MKYVIYLRVSTDMQDVRTQEQECLKYIQRLEKDSQPKYRLFVDDDVSTSRKMEKRPQLMAMLNNIKQKQHVVVFKLDRLSRDVVEMVTIHRMIKGKGCHVHSLHDSNADDEFIVGLMGVLAQKEKSDTIMRIKSKMNAKKERNERVSRHLPYGYALHPTELIAVKNQHSEGYTLKPGRLVPSPQEQAVLQVMFRLHAEGNSYRQIAKKLDEMAYKNREGKPFQHMSIFRILARTAQATSEDQFLEERAFLASH